MKELPARSRLWRVLLSLILLGAIGACSTNAVAETAPPAALCFQGAPNYTYAGEKLWINIQKCEPGDLDLTYYVCDVQTTDPAMLRTALAGDQVEGPRESTSDIAARHNARLAINGDCYDFHASGIIIRNGTVIRSKKTSDRHMLTLDADGLLTVYTDRGQEDGKALAQELLGKRVVQAWAFGPELVRDGKAVELKPFGLIPVRDNLREPRTAIGQIGPLHYVIIVVDGRSKGHSRGISLPDLQELFVRAGAQTAFNLDGGGSTTLYFNGEVINEPASGHQRAVSDILLF